MREGEKKIGGGGVVNVCLGREEKGTVYLSIHVPRVYFKEDGGQTDQIKI